MDNKKLSIQDVLNWDFEDVYDLFYDYVESFDEGDVPENERDIYENADLYIKGKDIEQDELLDLVLQLLIVKNLLGEDDIKFVRSGEFQSLMRKVSRETRETNDFWERMKDAFDTPSPLENIDRDMMKDIVLVMKDGPTLVSLANSTKWIRSFINESETLKLVKSNVLENLENVRLSTIYRVIQPFESDDYIIWYQMNFLTPECSSMYSMQDTCADSALFNGEFEYIMEHQLIPSHEALLIFGANIHNIVPVIISQTLLAEFYSYMFKNVTRTLSIKSKFYINSLCVATTELLTSNFENPASFLRTLYENGLTVAVKKVIDKLFLLLNNDRSDPEQIKLLIKGLTEALGAEFASTEFVNRIQRFANLKFEKFIRYKFVMLFKSSLPLKIWKRVRIALKEVGNILLTRISAQRNVPLTVETRYLAGWYGDIRSVLDYLK
jgi:hypothetical protein